MVSVELSGGLGNQLFQAFASMRIGEANRAASSVFQGPHFEASSHGNSISSIDWGERLNFIPVTKIGLLKSSALFQVSRRIGPVNLGQNSFDWVGANEFYFPSTSTNRVFLRGYFQNFLYFETLTTPFLPSLLQPSSGYISALKRVNGERPIGVHIRLGDYKKHLNTHGVLARDYYSKALARLGATSGQRQVWLFSDSPREALTMLEGLVPNSVLTNVQNLDLNDLENLFLLGACQDLVLGNSTFSLWSAFFSPSSGQILRPHPPFANLPGSSNL
jgi:hypothetical protein